MSIEIFTSFSVISDVGATANSYTSVADAKVLWDADPYKNDYTAYTDEMIGRALLSATKQIDGEYGSRYKGSLYDELYALFFPRTSIYDARGVSITDYTIFPPDIASATATQAWYVLQADREAEETISSVKQLKMDGLGSKSYFSPAEQRSLKRTLIHNEVKSIIDNYVSGGTSQYVSLIGRG